MNSERHANFGLEADLSKALRVLNVPSKEHIFYLCVALPAFAAFLCWHNRKLQLISANPPNDTFS